MRTVNTMLHRIQLVDNMVGGRQCANCNRIIWDGSYRHRSGKYCDEDCFQDSKNKRRAKVKVKRGKIPPQTHFPHKFLPIMLVEMDSTFPKARRGRKSSF